MVFPVLHLAIPCLLSECPLCNKTHQKNYAIYAIHWPKEKEKQKNQNLARRQNQKPKLNVFSNKVCDVERSIWRRGCFGIDRVFPSVATVSWAFCHPQLTAVASDTHRDDFPEGEEWRGMVAAPKLHVPWILQWGDAALLSTIPVPSLHHHGCTIPVSADTGALCSLRHAASLARLPQQPHSPQTFSGLLGFFNKSWDGDESHGSGHAPIDSFLNCHGLNNMPRPRCQYWYTLF